MRAFSPAPWTILAIAALVAVCLAADSTLLSSRLPAADEPAVPGHAGANPDAEAPAEFRHELLTGKVVWLAESLRDEFGISTVPEAAENTLALFTKDRQLLPIVEDLRGRAFRRDERLRGKDTELLVRRHRRHSVIQILRIYEIEDGNRYEIDYWCDVCAIVMFEKGPCSCCQDDNRLRKSLVTIAPGGLSGEAKEPKQP